MAVRLSRALQRRMQAEAAASPGSEVCGLLFGDLTGKVTAISPCANVASDPCVHFEIDPAALIAAHKAERAGGPKIIGWYHSHPKGAAEPSSRDADAAAEAGKIWLIIAQGEIRAWIADGSGGFDEAAVE